MHISDIFRYNCNDNLKPYWCIKFLLLAFLYVESLLDVLTHYVTNKYIYFPLMFLLFNKFKLIRSWTLLQFLIWMYYFQITRIDYHIISMDIDIGYESYIILTINMHADRISENHLKKFKYHKYDCKVSHEFRIQLFLCISCNER